MTGTASVVCGIGAHLPERVRTSAETASPLGVTEDWIVQRTGVHRRRVVSLGESTADMAVPAAARALASSGGSVQAVILATTTPDHRVPATAPTVASRLGLGTVPAWDLGAGCTGFLYGLAVATGLIHAGIAERVLVIGADAMTTLVDPRDRVSAPIFGDGAGAMVLRAGDPEEPGALGPFDLGSDGANAELLIVRAGGSRRPGTAGADDPRDHFMAMRGRPLFRHAVHRMTTSSRAALDRRGWRTQDVDRLIPHQANARIGAEVARVLGIAPQRCPSNIADVGNTVAATIPLLLTDLVHNGGIEPGQGVLLTAFGSGLAWGSTTLVWPTGLAASAADAPRCGDDARTT